MKNFADMNLQRTEKLPPRMMRGTVIAAGIIVTAWVLALPAGIVLDQLQAAKFQSAAEERIGGYSVIDDAVERREKALEEMEGEGGNLLSAEELQQELDSLLEELAQSLRRDANGQSASPWGGVSYRTATRNLEQRLATAQQKSQRAAGAASSESAIAVYEAAGVSNNDLVTVYVTGTANMELVNLSYPGADLRDGVLLVPDGEHVDIRFARTCDSGEVVDVEDDIMYKKHQDGVTEDISGLLINDC